MFFLLRFITQRMLLLFVLFSSSKMLLALAPAQTFGVPKSEENISLSPPPKRICFSGNISVSNDKESVLEKGSSDQKKFFDFFESICVSENRAMIVKKAKDEWRTGDPMQSFYLKKILLLEERITSGRDPLHLLDILKSYYGHANASLLREGFGVLNQQEYEVAFLDKILAEEKFGVDLSSFSPQGLISHLRKLYESTVDLKFYDFSKILEKLDKLIFALLKSNYQFFSEQRDSIDTLIGNIYLKLTERSFSCRAKIVPKMKVLASSPHWKTKRMAMVILSILKEKIPFESLQEAQDSLDKELELMIKEKNIFEESLHRLKYFEKIVLEMNEGIIFDENKIHPHAVEFLQLHLLYLDIKRIFMERKEKKHPDWRILKKSALNGSDIPKRYLEDNIFSKIKIIATKEIEKGSVYDLEEETQWTVNSIYFYRALFEELTEKKSQNKHISRFKHRRNNNRNPLLRDYKMRLASQKRILLENLDILKDKQKWIEIILSNAPQGRAPRQFYRMRDTLKKEELMDMILKFFLYIFDNAKDRRSIDSCKEAKQKTIEKDIKSFQDKTIDFQELLGQDQFFGLFAERSTKIFYSTVRFENHTDVCDFYKKKLALFLRLFDILTDEIQQQQCKYSYECDESTSERLKHNLYEHILFIAS